MKLLALPIAILFAAQAPPPAAPAPPSPPSSQGRLPAAADVLLAADRILAPDTYTAVVTMVAQRPDGSTRDYGYRVAKEGADKLALSFDRPAVLNGHAVLRKGEDLWRYVPSLKRAMRVSSRADFEGGDFRNADVLRVHLARDYEARGIERRGELYVLDLRAKTGEAAYDAMKLFVRASDSMPVREELFASSGKLLRTLECREPKDFGGHTAPSVFTMTNEVAKGRRTTMTIVSLQKDADIPATAFRPDAMGR